MSPVIMSTENVSNSPAENNSEIPKNVDVSAADEVPPINPDGSTAEYHRNRDYDDYLTHLNALGNGMINGFSSEADQPNDPGKMFIGGLSWQTTPESIREYFGTFGELAEVMVMKDPATRRSRGFGFITFCDSSAVEKVLASATHQLDGKTVEPKVAVPRKVNPKMHVKTKKIFVGGLSATTSVEDVRAYFEQFSKVKDAMLAYDKQTNRHRGFGFVTFDNDEVVDKICEIHFHEINGKMVESKKAMPREPRFGGGGGGYQNNPYAAYGYQGDYYSATSSTSGHNQGGYQVYNNANSRYNNSGRWRYNTGGSSNNNNNNDSLEDSEYNSSGASAYNQYRGGSSHQQQESHYQGHHQQHQGGSRFQRYFNNNNETSNNYHSGGSGNPHHQKSPRGQGGQGHHHYNNRDNQNHESRIPPVSAAPPAKLDIDDFPPLGMLSVSDGSKDSTAAANGGGPSAASALKAGLAF